MIGREARRSSRRPRVEAVFGSADAPSVLDLLDLVEMAWHDCYGEVSPAEEVIDDILTVSEGDWGNVVSAARLAVVDWRDLRIAAETIRRDTGRD